MTAVLNVVVLDFAVVFGVIPLGSCRFFFCICTLLFQTLVDIATAEPWYGPVALLVVRCL